MKVTEKDLKGDIKDFPIEVVQKMCEEQVKQGACFNIEDLQQSRFFNGHLFAFSEQGDNFWKRVIKNKDFDLFFEKYPKENAKPQQYRKGIDTFKRMEENATNEEKKGFVKGNIDKYLWRNKGQDKSDFEKICAYVEWGKKNVDWE